MENKMIAQSTVILSVIAAIFAVLDAFGVGIWLSASSWLLIAAVLGIWSLVFKPAK